MKIRTKPNKKDSRSRMDFVLTCMGVGFSVTVHLFLEICAPHGRWKDHFLSATFIRISKHNEQ
jgi:hypothetical protein